MRRIFVITAALSALMVILAGGGSFLFSAIKVADSEKMASSAWANSLVTIIASQMETLQNCVDGISRSPDVLAALNTGDPNVIAQVADKFQAVIPSALKLRILQPEISEADQTSIPHMGFGDLEMVHSSLSAKQKPVIQGEGEHRHLALTSIVKSDDRIIGVILVSMKPDILNQLLAKSVFPTGYAEIKQDQIILATTGNSAIKIANPETMTLNGSRWILDYWTQNQAELGDIGLNTTIILLPSLLACLVFFKGYRTLAAALFHDQASILKAAKDMMTGKISGNYPMLLDEMRPIITTLAQFKRAINQEDFLISQAPATSMDVDFLDDEFFIDDKNENSQEFTEIPPALQTEGSSSELATAEFLPTTEEKPATIFQSLKQGDRAIPGNIFRCYDIRGIVGQELSEDNIALIGRAIGSEAKQNSIHTIVVGRDGRLSSQTLAEALMRGICACGCHVIDIGLVPTPVLYFVAQHTEGQSGVMVTGSHNPVEYNGLKIVLNGEALADTRIQKLKTRIDSHDFFHEPPGTVDRNDTFVSEYIGVISEDIQIARPMTVVLDCGNGVAGELGPTLLKTLGCDVIELYCNIDGNFPNHHPDPSKPENMTDLSGIVQLHAADIGIAFDGDGDRLGIVDSQGKIIWPDRQLMLFARDVLARKPGADILYDVKCSKHLAEQIINRGGRPLMWKSGHSLMKTKLRETGAALAGEMSGHIFFNDRWFGFDDALYAAARMLQILSEDPRPSHEVFADLPDSFNTPELSVPLNEGESKTLMEQLFTHAAFTDANIIDLDGMRVEFADGWGLVRASNTTPSLMLRFEADSKEALSRIQSEFKHLIKQVKPDIALPF